MSYSVVVSCKVKSQTKVGVDDALASLVPAGEPTGNRAGRSSVCSSSSLADYLGTVDPLVGTNRTSDFCCLTMLPDGFAKLIVLGIHIHQN